MIDSKWDFHYAGGIVRSQTSAVHAHWTVAAAYWWIVCLEPSMQFKVTDIFPITDLVAVQHLVLCSKWSWSWILLSLHWVHVCEKERERDLERERERENEWYLERERSRERKRKREWVISREREI